MRTYTTYPNYMFKKEKRREEYYFSSIDCVWRKDACIFLCLEIFLPHYTLDLACDGQVLSLGLFIFKISRCCDIENRFLISILQMTIRKLPNNAHDGRNIVILNLWEIPSQYWLLMSFFKQQFLFFLRNHLNDLWLHSNQLWEMECLVGLKPVRA